MTTDIPRVSVTVVAFTSVHATAEISGPLLRDLIHVGSGPREFGLGLFALTRQSNPDQFLGADDGKRVLPATMVSATETVRDAARRLLGEELGIQRRGILRKTGVFDEVTREGDTRVISFGYWVYVPFDEVVTILGGRDKVGLELVSSSAHIDQWRDKKGLEDYDGVSRFGYRYRPTPSRGHKKVLTKEHRGDTILALDHDEIVFYSWREFRRGIAGVLDPVRYLGISPLPEAFSLSELRETFDVIRGERVQPDAFRRALTRDDSFVRQIDAREAPGSRGRGKPASLFEVKPWATPQPGKKAL